ncbi:MAG: Hpt domain-containing protein [Anaerovoracaceae bacterium]
MKERKTILQELSAWGVPMEETLERFVDDDELYVDCLFKFIEDDNFPLLEEAIKTENYDQAFNAAHTLKGVSGNLGLTSLSAVIINMVEAFRKGEYGGKEEQYAQIIAQQEKLKQVLGVE